MLSGFFILLEDQYAVGDLVDLGVATGRVERVTLRVTRLRDDEGKVWWVPNGQIVRAGNFTQDWARAVVDVALTRECDLEAATATITELAGRSVAKPDLADRVLEEPRVLGIQELTDDRVVLRVSVKVAKGAQDDVRHAIQGAVLHAYRDGRLVSPGPGRPRCSGDDVDGGADGRPVPHQHRLLVTLAQAATAERLTELLHGLHRVPVLRGDLVQTDATALRADREAHHVVPDDRRVVGGEGGEGLGVHVVEAEGGMSRRPDTRWELVM